MITLIGSEGSMGKRYQAILNYLKKPFFPLDRDHSMERIEAVAKDSEGIIIATPTPTHGELLRQLLPLKKPILCEKPITKDLSELKDLDAFCDRHGYDFHMMAQYKLLMNPLSQGDSHYDYFRTGQDGLVWDCLQIIGFARGFVEVDNQSPIWFCELNGTRLDVGQMDLAYFKSVEMWLKGQRVVTRKEIIEMHQKTDEYARAYYGKAD